MRELKLVTRSAATADTQLITNLLAKNKQATSTFYSKRTRSLLTYVILIALTCHIQDASCSRKFLTGLIIGTLLGKRPALCSAFHHPTHHNLSQNI